MKAYLEKHGKEWLDDFVYMSREPLERLGFKIVPFDGADLDDFFDRQPLKDDDVIVGSVEATTRFFKELGIEIPTYLGYPEELRMYMGRGLDECKLGDIDRDYPYFVKPSVDVKLFTGDIIESSSSMDFLKEYCGNINDDTMVYVSPVIDIKSEFRCFVFEGELRGIQFYQGDFKILPDVGKIQEMIRSWKDSPVAYTLDVGVADIPQNGEYNNTILVEVNDMWAIGSYGFDSKEYSLMCVRRMRQIINNNLIKNNEIL
jgi:hypothetical protein